jgi:hypothetical protein
MSFVAFGGVFKQFFFFFFFSNFNLVAVRGRLSVLMVAPLPPPPPPPPLPVVKLPLFSDDLEEQRAKQGRKWAAKSLKLNRISFT